FTSSWIRSLAAFFAFGADHVLDLLVSRVLLLGRDHVATVVELPRAFDFKLLQFEPLSVAWVAMTSTSQARRLPRATPRPFCSTGEFGVRALPTDEAVSSPSLGCLRLVHGISGQRPRIDRSAPAHAQGNPLGGRPDRDGSDE